MRNMVGLVSSDVIHLSVIYASRELGVSEEKTKELLKTLLSKREASTMWPEGFIG